MDEVRMTRAAEKIRKAYPAVAAEADAFQAGIPDPISVPCVGIEFDILERLRVLLADEAKRVTATSVLLEMRWAEVVGTRAGRAAINRAIVVAATGVSTPPDDGLQLSPK